MLKRVSPFILFLLLGRTFIQCHSTPEKNEMHFEKLDAAVVNDSLSSLQANYKEDFKIWKLVYERCMHDTLFSNAFYLGLQLNLGIGSISNQAVQNINKQITVLDT